MYVCLWLQFLLMYKIFRLKKIPLQIPLRAACGVAGGHSEGHRRDAGSGGQAFSEGWS